MNKYDRRWAMPCADSAAEAANADQLSRAVARVAELHALVPHVDGGTEAVISELVERGWVEEADELTELWRFVRYHLGSEISPDERQALDRASDEEIIGFLLRVLFRNGELELDAGTRAALEAGWMH